MNLYNKITSLFRIRPTWKKGLKFQPPKSSELLVSLKNCSNEQSGADEAEGAKEPKTLPVAVSVAKNDSNCQRRSKAVRSTISTMRAISTTLIQQGTQGWNAS